MPARGVTSRLDLLDACNRRTAEDRDARPDEAAGVCMARFANMYELRAGTEEAVSFELDACEWRKLDVEGPGAARVLWMRGRRVRRPSDEAQAPLPTSSCCSCTSSTIISSNNGSSS